MISIFLILLALRWIWIFKMKLKNQRSQYHKELFHGGHQFHQEIDPVRLQSLLPSHLPSHLPIRHRTLRHGTHQHTACRTSTFKLTLIHWWIHLLRKWAIHSLCEYLFSKMTYLKSTDKFIQTSPTSIRASFWFGAERSTYGGYRHNPKSTDHCKYSWQYCKTHVFVFIYF